MQLWPLELQLVWVCDTFPDACLQLLYLLLLLRARGDSSANSTAPVGRWCTNFVTLLSDDQFVADFCLLTSVILLYYCSDILHGIVHQMMIKVMSLLNYWQLFLVGRLLIKYLVIRICRSFMSHLNTLKEYLRLKLLWWQCVNWSLIVGRQLILNLICEVDKIDESAPQE